MKKIILVLLITAATYAGVSAQSGYGSTLNVGLGIGGYSGYYGYLGRSLPVFSINYELNVAKDFTLAPFASFYAYSNDYYWGK